MVLILSPRIRITFYLSYCLFKNSKVLKGMFNSIFWSSNFNWFYSLSIWQNGSLQSKFCRNKYFSYFYYCKTFLFFLFDLISIVDWCKTRILYQFFPKSSVWDSKIHHNLYHHMLVFLDLRCLVDLIYYNILYQTLPFISLLTELFLSVAESSLLNHFLFFYLLFFQILKSLCQMKTHDFIVNPDPFPLFLIF